MIVIVLVGYLLTSSAVADASSPVILGHRGAAGLYPEHTEISYEEGAKYADYIECDVQVTKVSFQSIKIKWQFSKVNWNLEVVGSRQS